MGVDNTKDVLLSLLSNALFQKPVVLPENIDYKVLYKESKYQAVDTLVFSALKKDSLPENIQTSWDLEFNMTLLNNSKVSYGHTLVHKLMSENKIDYVILKGCVSASYYDKPMLRKLGDVDFLVKSEGFEKAKKLFLDNGFELIKTNHEYELEFQKDDVVYELHKRVNGIPNNELGKKIDKMFDSIYSDATLVSDEFSSYMSPSVFHHGLVMLLHVARHMITGGIGLRHLCDWAVFVNSIRDEFLEVFEQKLTQIGLFRFAQILTAMCEKYLGCEKFSFTKDIDDKLLNELKDDVFAGGNFGKKDLSRADEAKFITSRKDGGVSDKSKFLKTVSSANEIVRKHWSWADKAPFVYPVGWIYYGTKYGVKAIFGKREKKDVSALLSGADKRIEIYKELELFE